MAHAQEPDTMNPKSPSESAQKFSIHLFVNTNVTNDKMKAFLKILKETGHNVDTMPSQNGDKQLGFFRRFCDEPVVFNGDLDDNEVFLHRSYVSYDTRYCPIMVRVDGTGFNQKEAEDVESALSVAFRAEILNEAMLLHAERYITLRGCKKGECRCA